MAIGGDTVGKAGAEVCVYWPAACLPGVRSRRHVGGQGIGLGVAPVQRDVLGCGVEGAQAE